MEGGVDAGWFQRFRVGPASSAVLAVSKLTNTSLALFLKPAMSLDIRRGDAAAAEDAYVGEPIEVGKSNRPGLHAAHGPVRLIGEGAEVGINEGNQVVDIVRLDPALDLLLGPDARLDTNGTIPGPDGEEPMWRDGSLTNQRISSTSRDPGVPAGCW